MLTVVDTMIEYGPENVGALVGSKVRLKSKFHHRSCKDVILSRTDEFGSSSLLYFDTKMKEDYGGRCNVSVSSNGECTLDIKDLQLSDAGTITWSSAVPGVDDQSRHTATVIVAGMFTG